MSDQPTPIDFSREVADRAKPTPDVIADTWRIYNTAGTGRTIAQSSRVVYRVIWERAARDLLGKATALDIQIWLTNLDLCAATEKKYLRCLRAVASVVGALTHDGYLHDELSRVRTAIPDTRRRKCPPDEAVRYLLRVAERPTELLAVRLAAFCGLRQGEIAALRLENVDHGVLHVNDTRDYLGLRCRKNARSGKKHIARPDAVTLRLIGEVIESRHLSVASPSLLAEGWLLPWRATRLPALWRKFARSDRRMAAWFGPYNRWHGLRHWGASRVARQTGSVISVQAWLGDSSPFAATCYCDQVRGTTEALADVAARGFDEQADGDFNTPPAGANPLILTDGSGIKSHEPSATESD
ncbi:MAG: hypothetical protein KAT00_12820 [Planctomycetes bacterium]|nr:hypothetical protein [Planctomycetota bacterium]